MEVRTVSKTEIRTIEVTTDAGRYDASVRTEQGRVAEVTATVCRPVAAPVGGTAMEQCGSLSWRDGVVRIGSSGMDAGCDIPTHMAEFLELVGTLQQEAAG